MELSIYLDGQFQGVKALESLENISTTITKKIKETKTSLEGKLKEFRRANEILEKRKLAMRARVEKKMKKIIKFDLGGQIFAIAKTDLTHDEYSFFFVLLSYDQWEPGEDGAYFIDINSKHFQNVLDHLRGESLSIRHQAEAAELFQYFHIISSPNSLAITLETDFGWNVAFEKKWKKVRQLPYPNVAVSLTVNQPSLPPPAPAFGFGAPMRKANPSPVAPSPHLAFLQEINGKLFQALSDVDNAIATVQNSISLIQAKVARLDELEKHVSNLAQQSTDVIRLDVGGKVFATLRSKLLANEGSYFHAMLSSGAWKPDDENERTYFINKNPQIFEYVMEYIRTQRVSFDGVDSETVKRIEELFEYFQITIKGLTNKRPVENTVSHRKCIPRHSY